MHEFEVVRFIPKRSAAPPGPGFFSEIVVNDCHQALAHGDLYFASSRRYSKQEATAKDGSGAEALMQDTMAHAGSVGQNRGTGRLRGLAVTTAEAAPIDLNGCLRLADDGKAMLQLLHSSRVYRVEKDRCCSLKTPIVSSM